MLKGKKIRYAVVGAGNIAQVAILPAFAHARENSKLVTFFCGSGAHRAPLVGQYGLERAYTYDDFELGLEEQRIDAVYIALPNHLHCEFAIRAARQGVHVLCEKPLAVTAADCQKMIAAARKHRVKLMTAYRLHFERSNIDAIELVKSGELGQPRLFNSIFAIQVRENDIRTRKDLGGGSLYDIGIYCINAARYLLQSEPIEAIAVSEKNRDPRFREIDEMTSSILRFPGNQLASFTTSFGASAAERYEVVGTKGKIEVVNGFGYMHAASHAVTVGGKTTVRTYPKRDHFAPELLYFSKCILEDIEPEPSGKEGLIDVQIVEALYRSARVGRPVPLTLETRRRRPGLHQEIYRPPIRKPRTVAAPSPSK